MSRGKIAGVALALGLSIGGAQALTVNIEYTGTVYSGYNYSTQTPFDGFNGQSYVADYVFDLSVPSPAAIQIGNPQINYIYGGTNYSPSTNTSPLVSATLTIGTSVFPVVTSPANYIGSIYAQNNGSFDEQIHDAYASSQLYLHNYVSNGGASSIPASIDLSFTYSVSDEAGASGYGTYCDGTICLGLLSQTLTETVASTPLPAALPLFAGGLGLIGLLARRRKQRHAATSH